MCNAALWHHVQDVLEKFHREQNFSRKRFCENWPALVGSYEWLFVFVYSGAVNASVIFVPGRNDITWIAEGQLPVRKPGRVCSTADRR